MVCQLLDIYDLWNRAPCLESETGEELCYFSLNVSSMDMNKVKSLQMELGNREWLADI